MVALALKWRCRFVIAREHDDHTRRHAQARIASSFVIESYPEASSQMSRPLRNGFGAAFACQRSET